MLAKRLPMRKIKEVLLLCSGQCLSKRKAASNCGASRPTVDEYLRRTEEAGLIWPLELLLFPLSPTLPAAVNSDPKFPHGSIDCCFNHLDQPGFDLVVLEPVGVARMSIVQLFWL